MIPAVIIATFFTGPQASLLDHAVLDMISKVGGEYGKQRLFGAVGYGLGAYLTGILVAVAGISWAFNISLVISLFSVFVLRFIPVIYHYAHDKKESSLEKSGSKQKPSLMNGLKFVSKQSDVLVLLIVVFTLGLMLGVLSSFLTLNMYNLSGGNANIIGVAIMCETSSELPAFFFSHKIIQKLGTVNVLLLSILAYALRISYYWYMTNPWSAIPFEFLHGVSFGLAWAAVTQYIYSSAPVGFEGTMMGILNAVQNGLGKGFGSMIGGYLYHTYGPKTMWLVSDLGAPLALIGVGLFTYFKTQDEEVDDEEVLENSQLMSPVAIDLKSPIFLPGGHRTQTISYESLA
jgi:MFS family permease